MHIDRSGPTNFFSGSYGPDVNPKMSHKVFVDLNETCRGGGWKVRLEKVHGQKPKEKLEISFRGQDTEWRY